MADSKQEMNNGTSQSRVVLAKPRLGGFGSVNFGASTSSKNSNPLGSVLRPPQLKPANNPFLKVTEVASTTEKEQLGTSSKEEQSKDEAPKFVPLGTGNVAPRNSNSVSATVQPAASASSSRFVFGQNLSDRVVMKENVNNGEASAIGHSMNGTELLFTSAAASVKENNQDEVGGNENGSSGEGLAAAAAEYERSHARPPPPTSYCTTTGEEGETNVLQISCRLYAWEAGSWRERGRGVLRLNDAARSEDAARLVARVAGSLRVVLNTKLWPDMVVERAGTKSLRITALDSQHQVKLFLIMGAPGDIIDLHKALTARVTGTKKPSLSNTRSQEAAERLEAAADMSEYIDKPVVEHRTDNFDHKAHTGSEQEKIANQCSAETRIEASVSKKTDDECDESIVDLDESKKLKRKEPIEDEKSPKRQCPDILIQ